MSVGQNDKNKIFRLCLYKNKLKDGANVIKQQFFFLLSQGLIIISSSWFSSLRRDKRVDHSEKKEGNEKNLRRNICNKEFTKNFQSI